jgi:hypothetical protein
LALRAVARQYSLIDLREILAGCNRRYLEFLSAMEDTSSGERDLARLSEPHPEIRMAGEYRIGRRFRG